MDALSKVPFLVILSIALWQIFQLPELPEHSSANVTYVMGKIDRLKSNLQLIGGLARHYQLHLSETG